MKCGIDAFGKLQKAIKLVLGYVLGLMMCVVFAQTFTRYVIFHSIPWSEELSRFLFVALIVLGINIGITEDMMVKIDILESHLGKRGKFIANLFYLIVGLLMNAAFAYSTFGLIKIGRLQKSPSMQISMSIMYIILLIGFVLAVLAVLVKILDLIYTYRKEIQ